MRKIIASIYISLDGVVEEPAWTMPYWSDELSQYADEQMAECDTLLLGRKTYDGFVQAWPNMTEAEGADVMNSIPKYVVTTTLETPEWNATFIKDNIIERITELKNTEGENFLIYGSGQLTCSLLKHQLIDELRLWVHPVVLGRGERLFDGIGEQVNLQLIDSLHLDTGVTILSYQPAS